MAFRLSPLRTGPLAAALLVAQVPCGRAAEISFRNDVQAVIAKAGCNLGTCHGNTTGKGGFKMSLRGTDLDYDHTALTQEAGGRRINLVEPERSLILQKATQAIAHEGGKRFAGDSWEYRTLRDWLAQGAARRTPGEPLLERLEVAPGDRILVAPVSRVQLQATAVFSDGTRRDVTAQAVYEMAQVGLATVSRQGRVDKIKDGELTVIVRFLERQQPVRLAFVPARPEFEWTPVPEDGFIDRHIFAKLRSLRMTPSALCDDTVFVRRAFLDLLGAPPTADEARAFAADTAPDKRVRLVDRLLARPEFADFWALKWADALRVEPRTMDLRGMTAFHAWIRDAVAANMPVDRFARSILAAQGSTYRVPEANFYRALREPNVRAEAVAQVFLGTRLKCAQCHNHPFDRWTQDDYFDWAAVFGRIDYEVRENKRKDKNDKHEFVGEQIVKLTREARLANPRTGEPAQPRLLGASSLGRPDLDGLRELETAARWLSHPDNALFARAQVNRIWFHLLGRGLVDPVDDFRITNPASHPALLEALARDFVASGFDMKRLIRIIMTSRTYQLSSEPNDTNGDDQANGSHTIVRRLGAEQLHDALHQFAGVPGEFAAFPLVARAVALPGPVRMRKKDGEPGASDLFLRQFGQPPRLLACECERSSETSIGQAFALISSPRLDDLIRRPDNVITTLLRGKAGIEQTISELYWRALSRPPTGRELGVLAALVAKAPADRRRAAFEDIAWSLVNSKEFVLRR